MVFFTIRVPSEYHPGTIRVPSGYHPGTIRVPSGYHPGTQCSVAQRHNVLFRKDTVFCFAKTQCSVCRKRDVLFTVYSVAYHPGTIRVPSGHPDGRRIVLRFASKLRSKGPIEFVSKFRGITPPRPPKYNYRQYNYH